MIQPNEVPTPRVFSVNDNTLADIPGVPQIPVFPVQTQAPMLQHLMEFMSELTRDSFTDLHYHCHDPVDIEPALANFSFHMATDLYRAAITAIEDNRPRDVTLYAEIAHVFQNSGYFCDSRRHPNELDSNKTIRNMMISTRGKFQGLLADYADVMLEAWRNAGQPEAYIEPETNEVIPNQIVYVD